MTITACKDKHKIEQMLDDSAHDVIKNRLDLLCDHKKANKRNTFLMGMVLFGQLCGAIWWASDQTATARYVRESVDELKIVVTKNDDRLTEHLLRSNSERLYYQDNGNK